MLLIVDPNGAGLGYIEFDRPVKYLDAYEVSYLVLDPDALDPRAQPASASTLAALL